MVEREGVNVLCMAPTEYRADRQARASCARCRRCATRWPPASRSTPRSCALWQDEVGVAIHDGYGQTETGALTGMPIGPPVRPGSMGRPLPGFRCGSRTASCAPTRRRSRRSSSTAPRGTWRTGDRVREDEDGYLWFEGRADDVIISAGYRIGPFEVESALVSHPAVAEAAAVAAPDEERGAVVRAVVVLRDGHEPGDELARELQDHVKAETAPYKYPRIVEFADALPKTASGKIRRAVLREAAARPAERLTTPRVR